MFTAEINSRASSIRRQIKAAGYTKKVWPAALKCAYRYNELTDLPEQYEKKEYQIVKRNGSSRTIKATHAKMKNETTFQVRDMEDKMKFKSFRIWQLLKIKDQPIF